MGYTLHEHRDAVFDAPDINIKTVRSAGSRFKGQLSYTRYSAMRAMSAGVTYGSIVALHLQRDREGGVGVEGELCGRLAAAGDEGLEQTVPWTRLTHARLHNHLQSSPAKTGDTAASL